MLGTHAICFLDGFHAKLIESTTEEPEKVEGWHVCVLVLLVCLCCKKDGDQEGVHPGPTPVSCSSPAEAGGQECHLRLTVWVAGAIMRCLSGYSLLGNWMRSEDYQPPRLCLPCCARPPRLVVVSCSCYCCIVLLGTLMVTLNLFHSPTCPEKMLLIATFPWSRTSISGSLIATL